MAALRAFSRLLCNVTRAATSRAMSTTSNASGPVLSRFLPLVYRGLTTPLSSCICHSRAQFSSIRSTLSLHNSPVGRESGQSSLLRLEPAVPTLSQQVRCITKFSLRRGTRKTCKAVIRRFFRLNCGLWIRPRSGRAKKLWKKSEKQLQYLRRHVFCNKTQCKMLDKMVTAYWKKPKYYVDDPYEPYHERHNFPHVKKTW
ncbi:unnamed protein product [Ixodes pacificus]